MGHVSMATIFRREGLVQARSAEGFGQKVVGDPCVVWDPEIDGWRMVLFFQPPGHAHAVSFDRTGAPGSWSNPEPLTFTNPERFFGEGTHKPFIVLDPHLPNRAAFVEGHYWMYTVDAVGDGQEKHIHRARAVSLGGPWTLDAEVAIPRGGAGEFDELHTDVPSAYYFPELGEFVCFYMGYPRRPQESQPGNPFGSAIGAARQRPDEPRARKQGALLSPPADPRHWASGYLGGLQVLPGVTHRWVGVLNASPTKPTHDRSLTAEEPAPSLGGLAFCDEVVPLSGWTLSEAPFEWIQEIPSAALGWGEGTNLWRHHALVVGDLVRILYNSGYYGQEQMYTKVALAADLGVAPIAHPADVGVQQ